MKKKNLIYLISRVFFFCLDFFKFSAPAVVELKERGKNTTKINSNYNCSIQIGYEKLDLARKEISNYEYEEMVKDPRPAWPNNRKRKMITMLTCLIAPLDGLY